MTTSLSRSLGQLRPARSLRRTPVQCVLFAPLRLSSWCTTARNFRCRPLTTSTTLPALAVSPWVRCRTTTAVWTRLSRRLLSRLDGSARVPSWLMCSRMPRLCLRRRSNARRRGRGSRLVRRRRRRSRAKRPTPSCLTRRLSLRHPMSARRSASASTYALLPLASRSPSSRSHTNLYFVLQSCLRRMVPCNP